MFRQHLSSCTCELFSPTLHTAQFRSPPAHFNRQQIRSKRSLKSQSSSRTKHFLQQNQLLSKFQQLSSKKQQISNFHQEASKIQSSIAAHIRAPVVNVRLKKNQHLFKVTKENQPIKFHLVHYNQRMVSPLHSQNQNVFTQISPPPLSGISHKYQQERVVTLNSPSLLRTQKNNERSAATTLAGSVAPSIQQAMDRASIVSPIFQKNHRNLINFSSKQHQPSSSIEEASWRPGSSAYGISRLSEMMNEKAECQSIYDGQKTLTDQQQQQSRVLISYKKMVEQKKDFLQESIQRKLFDFNRQPSRNNHLSHTFDKITLVTLNR